MMDVLLQAGHSSTYDPLRANGGGAPGEAGWTTDLVSRVAEKLKGTGLRVVTVGHWFGYPAPVAVRTFSFKRAYSYHYDAAIYSTNTGGFADRYRPFGASDPRRLVLLPDGGADPKTYGSHLRLRAERERIIPLRAPEPGNPNADTEEGMIANWHAALSAFGIPIVTARRNPNTWDYYGYQDTSADTSMILVEFGVGQGIDHALLFNEIDRLAQVCFLATLRDLDLPLPLPVPIPTPEEEDEMAKLTDEQREMLSLMDAPLSLNPQAVRDLITVNSDYTQRERPALQTEIASLKDDLEQCRNQPPPEPPTPEPVTITSVYTRIILSNGDTAEAQSGVPQ